MEGYELLDYLQKEKERLYLLYSEQQELAQNWFRELIVNNIGLSEDTTLYILINNNNLNITVGLYYNNSISISTIEKDIYVNSNAYIRTNEIQSYELHMIMDLFITNAFNKTELYSNIFQKFSDVKDAYYVYNNACEAFDRHKETLSCNMLEILGEHFSSLINEGDIFKIDRTEYTVVKNMGKTIKFSYNDRYSKSYRYQWWGGEVVQKRIKKANFVTMMFENTPNRIRKIAEATLDMSEIYNRFKITHDTTTRTEA
jgi:hypothetical protein